MSNWKIVIWSCLFFILLNSENATADLNRKIDTAKITRHEEQIGPFTLKENDFTVILKLLKYKGASTGFDETVESFSIVDNKGAVHYQKSFTVEYGNEGFVERISISAYALDTYDRKIFLNESRRLKQTFSNGHADEGLILYYGIVPSAPLAGVSCQVFVLQEARLVSLFSPLGVYGRIYELPHGSHPNSQKLFKGNTIRLGVWTGWFEVIVPIGVFDRLRVVPLHYHSTFGYNAFDVKVERRNPEEETFVRLFEHPEISSIPQHVIIKKDTKVAFLWAYANVSIESSGAESRIFTDAMPWLKVQIDGKQGFVRDAEDLLALGIQPAG